MEKFKIGFIIIIVVSAIIFINKSQNKAEKYRKSLYKNGVLTIGVFESRNYSNGKTYSISFSYFANGEKYKNGDTRCYLDSEIASDAFTNSDIAKSGDKFLVLYDSNDPQESIIRLDYPINSESDIKKYKNKLKP